MNLRTYHLKRFAKERMPLAISFQKWKAGDASPEHLHDSVELIYFLKGGGFNFIDGEAFPIIAGDLYIVDNGSVHSFRADSDLELYNLMFHFSAFSRKELQLLGEMERFGSFFSRGETRSAVSRAKLVKKLFLPPPLSGKFKDLFERLYMETSKAEPGHRMNCKAYLILLLTELCRAKPLLDGGKLASVDDEADSLSRVLAFINRNYLRPVSLPEIAAASGLSPSYISEFFRRRTGATLVKYVNTLRIELARRLLQDRQELSVSEVAHRCGFEDPCYFAEVFRRLAGASPSEFRRAKI